MNLCEGEVSICLVKTPARVTCMSPLRLVGSQDGVCAFLGYWLWELSFSYVPSFPNPPQTGAAGQSVHPRLDPNPLDFLNFRHQAVLKVFRLEAASPRTLKRFSVRNEGTQKIRPPYSICLLSWYFSIWKTCLWPEVSLLPPCLYSYFRKCQYPSLWPRCFTLGWLEHFLRTKLMSASPSCPTSPSS